MVGPRHDPTVAVPSDPELEIHPSSHVVRLAARLLQLHFAKSPEAGEKLQVPPKAAWTDEVRRWGRQSAQNAASCGYLAFRDGTTCQGHRLEGHVKTKASHTGAR